VEAEYKGSAGRIAAGVDQFGTQTALRGGLRGAIATAGNAVFLSNPIQNSFAVVDTGQPDVGVLYENHPSALLH
jgi:outer membrane usher protein